MKRLLQKCKKIVNQYVRSNQEIDSSDFFVPLDHFYSPMVVADELTTTFKDFYDAQSSVSSLDGIDIDGEKMNDLWVQFSEYIENYPFSEHSSDEYTYYLDNGSFVYGDGLILHSMIRHFKPKRIIEIGSGFSSACIFDTSKFLSSPIEIIYIEPYPDLLYAVLPKCAQKNVTIIAEKIQNVDLSYFKQLQENDFLFIDSTHIMKTGSDVMHEFFTIMPMIKPGVFVHFHDIFWPFEYPKSWIFENRKYSRSWNELYGLRALLTNNSEYEIVFFNDYFGKIHKNIANKIPHFAKNPGGSIWLRKCARDNEDKK
ncbi:MAG: class I SAM-dependent methyltransferase [Desulfovibrionaceae bacterium]|nr:class I SAM-dependent methyltransferase [Desulfovibrionaceae bacterium]